MVLDDDVEQRHKSAYAKQIYSKHIAQWQKEHNTSYESKRNRTIKEEWKLNLAETINVFAKQC